MKKQIKNLEIKALKNTHIIKGGVDEADGLKPTERALEYKKRLDETP